MQSKQTTLELCCQMRRRNLRLPFAGQLASGIIREGQPVIVLPTGFKTTMKDIWNYDRWLAEAFFPQSVTLCLEHDIDVSRGDMIAIFKSSLSNGSNIVKTMKFELGRRFHVVTISWNATNVFILVDNKMSR